MGHPPESAENAMTQLSSDSLVPGRTLPLPVEGLISDGRGLARHEGRAVFVAGALPGQTVLARITAVKRRLAEAESLELLQQAPDARPAACPHAEACGGCPWQSLPYPAQLAWKQRFVTDALQRIGKIADPPVAPILASPEEWGYRNKMEFAIGLSASSDGLEIGLRPRGSRDIVPVSACRLQSPLTMRLVAAARAAIRETDNDMWRYLVIREPRAGGCLVEAVAAPLPEARLCGERLATALHQACPEMSGFVLSERAGSTDVAYGERVVWRTGVTELVESLGKVRFNLGAGAFFQINTPAATLLYDAVVRLAVQGAVSTVWDVYCGVGSIGLYLALHAPVRRLVGIERSAAAVRLAKRNARALAPELECAFHAGNAARLPGGSSFRETPDLVIVDPPRAGLDAGLVSALIRLHPERILYVSCDPATLARDVERLRGYSLRSACPVDLFPQTPHVECVCLLEQR